MRVQAFLETHLQRAAIINARSEWEGVLSGPCEADLLFTILFENKRFEEKPLEIYKYVGGQAQNPKLSRRVARGFWFIYFVSIE